jgi:hypothetical protein
LRINLLLVSLASVALLSTTALSQSIEEMYYEVPAALIGLPIDLEKETGQPADKNLDNESGREIRKSRIKTLDNKSGYLELKGGADKQIAKFSLKGEAPVFVVAETSYADAGSLDNQLIFLTKNAGKWVDVTERWLPTIPGFVVDAFSRDKCGVEISNSASGTWRYILPRQGRTIRAVAESDVLTKPCKGDLFHLEFDSMKIINTGWHDRLIMKLVK